MTYYIPKQLKHLTVPPSLFGPFGRKHATPEALRARFKIAPTPEGESARHSSGKEPGSTRKKPQGDLNAPTPKESKVTRFPHPDSTAALAEKVDFDPPEMQERRRRDQAAQEESDRRKKEEFIHRPQEAQDADVRSRDNPMDVLDELIREAEGFRGEEFDLDLDSELPSDEEIEKWARDSKEDVPPAAPASQKPSWVTTDEAARAWNLGLNRGQFAAAYDWFYDLFLDRGKRNPLKGAGPEWEDWYRAAVTQTMDAFMRDGFWRKKNVETDGKLAELMTYIAAMWAQKEWYKKIEGGEGKALPKYRVKIAPTPEGEAVFKKPEKPAEAKPKVGKERMNAPPPSPPPPPPTPPKKPSSQTQILEMPFAIPGQPQGPEDEDVRIEDEPEPAFQEFYDQALEEGKQAGKDPWEAFKEQVSRTYEAPLEEVEQLEKQVDAILASKNYEEALERPKPTSHEFFSRNDFANQVMEDVFQAAKAAGKSQWDTTIMAELAHRMGLNMWDHYKGRGQSNG